jgi:NAD(P)-dependent dehydrogenase (short-subunit alcohol dehydrogenase family)
MSAAPTTTTAVYDSSRIGTYLHSLFSLHSRTVLLTGASSGIGEHFAWTLARAGASRLVLAARRIDRLNVLAETIMKEYPTCQIVVIKLDVGEDLTHIRQALDDAERKLSLLHGGGENNLITIDVVINNAGIGPNSHVLAVTEKSYNETMNINVRGAFFIAQECSNRWVKRGMAEDFTNGKNQGLSIINISSIYGVRVGINNSHYVRVFVLFY